MKKTRMVERMNNSLKDEHMDNLFRAVLKLETVEDCYRFFNDLCTISELKSISQRFEVALMLDEKHIYTDIASKTGASTATISRVNRCLNYGEGGYRMMLDRMKETRDE
jgi:TrpR-related protein YerC/YecD